MGIWEQTKQAKKKNPELFERWYDAAREEMTLAAYGEQISEDTAVRLYGVRSKAEGLWKELFDV